MTGENRCPHCGCELPANAPEGVCPRCLLQAGLGNDAEKTAQGPAREGPGSHIGRYELLELIGEGGMGLVYLAEQTEPVKRRVALKIIKPGMDSKEVIARFEAERQTLAVLDHPNIAHVFDAGMTDTGRPYFVMEHVRGLSITEYSDERKLSVEARLKLFKEVCEGVHHAHQKGIIHRDIKPSNILVSVHGERAVPKIIDFGIAKAITRPLTGKTVFTYQGQLLGTPEYMSPEQVDLATQDIDTRSDIYSLGVLLYELLAGVLPFDRESFKRAGFAEIRKTIRDEEPSTPSTRLTSLGEKAKEIAERRRTQLLALARCLHRELEWIPMKAMRKDRTRRYRSASELADDIQNYLTGVPLIAGPETSVYRARKFVRKHAGSVSMAALVAVVVILALIASIVMGHQAEEARDEEVMARAEAEQARDQEATLRAQVERALQRVEEAEKVARDRADKYRHLSYVHSVALADAKYRERNLSSAQILLESSPPDLRGWEWYRLDQVMDQASITFDTGSRFLWSIAISPDGERIASGDMDGTVTVWDAVSGAQRMVLKGHAGPTASMAFSKDGQYLVSGSFDGTARVWNARSGDEIMTLRHGEQIVSVLYSWDGTRIISIARYRNKTIKIWDATSGEEMTTIECGEQRSDSVESVALSPDGRQLVAGQYDGALKLWDVATGKELRTLHGHEGGIFSVSFSPDGTHIVLGAFDGTVKILNAVTGEEESPLKGHGQGGEVATVTFSPDGKRVASGSFDHTIKVWDTTTGDEVTTLIGHQRRLSGVVFSPNGKRIISSSFNGKIKIWDPDTRTDRMVLQEPKGGFQDSVGRIDFSPDGGCMASVGSDNTIRLWNIAEAKEIRVLKGHEHTINCLDFSPDGRRLVSASRDQTIKIFDAESGNELRTLHGHKGWVSSVAFSPDGQQIVSGSWDKTIKLWEAATGEELMTLPRQAEKVLYVAFSPNGKRIVSCSGEKITVWDTATGDELVTLSGHTGFVLSAAFSPDGKRIISGSYDYTIRLWDTATGDEEMKLLGHNGKVVPVAFSPDGKRIVSGSHDGTAKIWDATTGFELITLVVHSGSSIQSTVFSPDGKTLAAVCSEGSIILWQSRRQGAQNDPDQRTAFSARSVSGAGQ